MENAKLAPTQLPTSTRLTDKDSPLTDKERALNENIPYALAVGSIMYVMVVTWPNLAYAIRVVNGYMSNQGWKHWEAIKHIVRYLGGTEDIQLTFGSTNSTEIEGYTQSYYADIPNTKKSTSGYIFTYSGGAISCRSKLQECTTLSTIEAEYIDVSKSTKEAIWLHRLLTDF